MVGHQSADQPVSRGRQYQPFSPVCGVAAPRENVATLARSAMVIEGVSRSRHALLNGDTTNYDWDHGYTCHQLGSGSVVVQLGQPFLLSSLRSVVPQSAPTAC